MLTCSMAFDVTLSSSSDSSSSSSDSTSISSASTWKSNCSIYSTDFKLCYNFQTAGSL
jgi:hypothetical protein